MKDEFTSFEKSTKTISFNLSEFSPQDFTYHKLETTVLMYIQSSNGFIGHDIVQLKHCLFDVLLYYHILQNELLSQREITICGSEIKLHFYYYISCLYNIEQKFLSFVNCKTDKGLIFNETVLTDNGIHEVSDLFSETYRIISSYINARHDLVHKKYDYSYDINTNSIRISCFSFDLSTSKDTNTNSFFTFSIIPDDILSSLFAIYKLRHDFINILKDKTNIDYMKLLNKFIITENGKDKVDISF